MTFWNKFVNNFVKKNILKIMYLLYDVMSTYLLLKIHRGYNCVKLIKFLDNINNCVNFK